MVKPTTIIVSVLAVVGALALAVVAIFSYLSPDAAPSPTYSPRAVVATLAPLPPVNAKNNGPGVVNAASPDWITRVAAATSIPPLSLRAYAGATLSVAAGNPGCQLSWNTLAGVGWVESRHGLLHGRTLTANGAVTPPLYGVALDGNGFAHVPDSDGGAIDGDKQGDRAVGPMQFLPQSWRNWHTDANGDGVEDVQNIFDSSLAAAHYLCRAAGSLGTQEGWRKGILSYNSSQQYLNDVMDAANRYAAEAASAG